jgi:hypothetical protein
LVVTCLVLSISLANASLSCNEMIETTTPCIGYLQNPGPSSVPEPCCNGVRNVNDAAKTTNERRDACRCLKPVVNAIAGIKEDALTALPGNCGVNLPFKIGLNINCDTYISYRYIFFLRKYYKLIFDKDCEYIL